MKKPSKPTLLLRQKIALTTAVAFTTCNLALADTTQLADVPLANATTVTILPNIFFILDDSGSMDSDYMPDYVYGGGYCRDNYTEDGDTNGRLDRCFFGDPPYMASAFNGVYYNPMINYLPPKNADGTDKTSYGSPWASVPLDGYGVQFQLQGSYPRDANAFSRTTTPDDWAHGRGTSINLTTQFPERKWCTSGSNQVTCTNNTVSALDGSNAYVYPDSNYKYLVTTFGAPYYYNVTVEWCKQVNGSGADKNFGKAGTCQSKKTSTYQYVRYSNWSRVDIVPARNSYPGPSGTTRTYAEEMTNFANWFAWYRTRIQMAKSSMSRAFAEVRGTPNNADATDKNYFHARVGFTVISNSGATDGSGFLAINNFDSAQKSTFFSRLFANGPYSWTPLRGALSKAGRIYAGQLGADPLQYSCQRNFTIMTTDGYWNDNIETSSYGPYKMDGSTLVGDQDGPNTVTRPEYDSSQAQNTLADVAYYYYHTDLRPGACTKCTDNVPPAGTDAKVDDVASHQHMTTFTIGLGVDGTLAYQDGYKTSTSGDYYDIKQGTKNWPDPIANVNEERIDDLWHAAVNGRGTYFSARDPESLVTGLNAALGSMQAATGSGAAAATSNLQPTAGDNFIYIANYRTVNWDGELSAYTIDLSTGAISSTTTWQASKLLANKIASTGDSDTRTIYTWSPSASNHLKTFTWNALSTTEKSYFDTSLLNQYSDWNATEKSAATGESLVNYLRGQDRNEDQDRAAGYGTYYRLYRDREKILGDIVHSQPVYVKAPFYSFLDTGYSTFLSANATRAPTVYVAANDGMLHAFDATTGAERWGYLPPMVLKNLYRLADRVYPTNHRFFIDGPISVSDVYIGGVWKTILVGAFGKGGRGYYALDITDPSAPQALWNFTADDNPNLGYSYGTPLITKLADGTWVVVVGSGYNNVPEGGSYTDADGKGRVFVLNAGTGTVIKTISTDVGSVASPSGLAYLNVKVNDFQHDNTAIRAYGGDLYGNMWRFDLDNGTVSKVVALGSTQPITVPPEIGEVSGNTVLFFGTGRYLGSGDLANTDQQSFYAIKDNGTTEVNPATQLVKQTMANNADRTITGTSEINWSEKFGWYFDLPAGKERVVLPAQLYFGTIIFASTIPDATECQPGGSGVMYAVDAASGFRVAGATQNAWSFTSPIVGITVAKLPGGTAKIYGITADGGYPKGAPPTMPIAPGGGAGGETGWRVMWRELTN